MRVTTTAIIGTVAIVLAAAIHFVDRQPVAGPEAAKAANVLVRFDSDDVERVVVETGDHEVVLTRQEGLWFFEEPARDRVDGEALEALLDELNHLSIVDTLDGGEQDPAEMGIEGDAAIEVTLTGAEDSFEETVVVGSEAPRSDSVFARREAGEAHVVEGNPREWLEQPLRSLRDARLVSAPVERITQLGVRRSSGEVSLRRRVTPPQQDWAIVEPLQTWASPEKLEQLLADLSGLRIEDVLDENAPGKVIPDPLPEKAVVVQIGVLGFETPLTLYLEQVEPPPADGAAAVLEARVSDRPARYQVRSDILQQLPHSANDVRDRTLARIPLQYVDRIFIQSRIDPVVYLESSPAEQGKRWQVRINDQLVPANNDQVSSLITGMNEAAIQDFASDSGEDFAKFGLEPPARKITLQLQFPGEPGPDGSPGQVREVQRVLRLGWQEGDEKRLFANFEGEPYVYEVDPSFATLIPTHPIKWRSRNVLTFNPVRLVSITREVDGQGKLKLAYDYKRDEWEATRNGVDVTSSLDVGSARRLRDRLGSLTASGWYLSLARAYEALEEPKAEFTIVTKELDSARGDVQEQTYELKLAPAGTELYFGRLKSTSDIGLSQGSPDVFILDHETYRNLIRPVTTSRLSNP